jgi:hypothetical protein
MEERSVRFLRSHRSLMRMLPEDRHTTESRFARELPLLRRLRLDLLDELGDLLLLLLLHPLPLHLGFVADRDHP